jgi:hypothetical protein
MLEVRCERFRLRSRAQTSTNGDGRWAFTRPQSRFGSWLLHCSLRAPRSVGFVVLGHLRNGLNSSKPDADDPTLIERVELAAA